jgi:hypothetical protein
LSAMKLDFKLKNLNDVEINVIFTCPSSILLNLKFLKIHR